MDLKKKQNYSFTILLQYQSKEKPKPVVLFYYFQYDELYYFHCVCYRNECCDSSFNFSYKKSTKTKLKYEAM